MRANKIRSKWILVILTFILLINIISNFNLDRISVNKNETGDLEESDFINNYSKLLHAANNAPNGKPLKINQFANISRTFSNVQSSQNLTFPLVEGWKVKNTTIYYEGVQRQHQWISNYHFTDNADEWNYVEEDSDGSFWEGGYVDWDVGGRVGTVNFGMSGTTLARTDYAGYQNNFTISGETLANKFAFASVDYYYDIKGSYPNASIYMSILIDGVEKNISRSLDEIATNQWETLSIQYNAASLGQTLPGDVSVFAGVIMNEDTTQSQGDTIYLDNIKLTLWTNLNNTPGLIKTHDVSTDTNYQYYNTSFGRGYAYIDLERTNPGDITFTVFENISQTIDFIDFNVQSVTILSPSLKTFNTTYNGKVGSFYTTDILNNWKTEFPVSIPTYYTSWIEISKPIDWSIISVLDGFNSEKIGGCSGGDSGSSTLSIPHSLLIEGTWRLEAESQNYIDQAKVSFWNVTSNVETSRLTIGDVFHVNATLNNTLSILNSQINCTIRYPNNTILWQETKIPTQHEVQFNNLVVGTNMTVGSYTAQIYWTNNESYLFRDQVGFYELEFIVWHHTNLSAVNSYYELLAGDPLLLKVKFVDNDTYSDIDFADVTFSSSYGLEGAMAYQGLGIYFVELDTSSLDLGDYYFSFNATKTYFENQSKINLIHLKIIAQPLVLEFSSRTLDAMGNNYSICRVTVEGENSGSPLYPANLSCDWTFGYSIFDHTNGTYSFNFSTYNLPKDGTLDTFEIEIFANKTNHGSTSDFISLIIHPVNTLGKINNSHIEAYINEEFDVKINYTEEATGKLIEGAECSVSWETTYDINTVSDGFIIKYYTSGLNIESYSSLIVLSKDGYEDSLISLTINVKEQKTSITVEAKAKEIIQNDIVELYFKESVNISARIFADREGKFLSGGLITFLSDNFQKNFTEVNPSNFSILIPIDGDYFNSGLNSIYLRFEQQNYTTIMFSFQFYILAQSVILEVEVEDQAIPVNTGEVEVTYNDFIYISCRVFAEAEAIYLSGGDVKLIVDQNEINFTESINFWYNQSIFISTNVYSLGINYVYLKFDLANYTTTTFSFQIYVKQVELEVRTLDFTDTISAYSGESLSIWINLTELYSNTYIDNATVYCYWQFGTYFFENMGDGLYRLNLASVRNLGTHRFNLVVTTNEAIYKTTEYSFLIIITEKPQPNYLFWIIALSLIVLVGILGSLSVRSYIILPKKKKRELIITSKTQPYKDIRNIEAILVSNRRSGISLYSRTFSILDENYITGFSGFIQAITILGKEYTKNGVKIIDIEANVDEDSKEERDIRELDFNFFHSLICDYGELRLVLLLRQRSSEQLRSKINILTREIYMQNKDIIRNFSGNLTGIKNVIENVIYRHLPLYYKGNFVLNKSKHYHSIKVSGKLTNLEIRILNVLESQTKYRKQFLLNDIPPLFEKVNEDDIIIAIESLISQKMIKPIS